LKTSRKTNAQLSLITQKKLLSATQECLIVLGYANTTTAQICKRARVSNGSLLHHFGTKNKLMSACLEDIYCRLDKQLEESTMGIEDSHKRINSYIEELFKVFDSLESKAVIEMWLAAKNNKKLHKEVFPLMQKFADTVTPRAASCLPDLAFDYELLAKTMRYIVVTLQGYSLALIAFGRNSKGETEMREFIFKNIQILLEKL